MQVVIPIPTSAEFYGITVAILTAAWTVYQEYRHRKNHGTSWHRSEEITQEKHTIERLKQKL